MTLLAGLKTFTPTTTSAVKHVVEVIESVTHLPEVFKKDLVLIQLDESSTLYNPENPQEQYELVHVEPGDLTVVTHYEVKSPSHQKALNITECYQEYLATGKVSVLEIKDNTNIHNIPIPAYTLEMWNGEYVPCVLLNNGKRALVVDGEFIEGVEFGG